MERSYKLVRIALTAPNRGHRAKRPEIGEIDVEDAVPVLEGRVVATQLVLEGSCALSADGDAGLVFRRNVELTFEHVDQARPLSLRFVEPREGVERLRILSAQLEHALPRLDGPLGLPELGGRKRRDLGANVGFRGVSRNVCELGRIHGIELLPCTLTLVDPGESRHGT